MHPVPSLKYYTLVSFFVIGIITVLLGQMLPILSARLDLNDAQAGTLFLAQFTGSMLGTLLAIRAARRVGFILPIVAGFSLIAIGLPMTNIPNFAASWVAIFIYGSGLGVTIPSINLLTIETTPIETQTASVNLLNFCWGAGAICSQPFVASVSHDNSLAGVTMILVFAAVILAICFLVMRGKVVERSIDEVVPESETAIWRRRSTWLFALFVFFVVSIEGALGGWLTTYTEFLKQRGVETINLTVVYFTFFVLGRGLASIISRRVSDNVLIFVCAGLAVIGMTLIVSGEILAVAGAAITGLGSSAIFPTNMVRFTRVFGPSATRQSTPIFISGTLGAASVSALVGLVSTRSGSLRMGIVVLLVAAIAAFVLQTVIAMVFRGVSRAREQ